jgi:catechol 2,3-dioxygenase-like lactoylglutathione lyase family enzyme
MDNPVNDHQVITFLVKDLERSSRFYNECLGLLLEEQEPGLYVQFDLGGRSLRLMRGGEQDETQPEGHVLRISINDTDKMSENFTCRSIAFLQLKDAFGARYLQVQDPDGHKIILKQK